MVHGSVHTSGLHATPRLVYSHGTVQSSSCMAQSGFGQVKWKTGQLSYRSTVELCTVSHFTSTYRTVQGPLCVTSTKMHLEKFNKYTSYTVQYCTVQCTVYTIGTEKPLTHHRTYTIRTISCKLVHTALIPSVSKLPQSTLYLKKKILFLTLIWLSTGGILTII